MEWLYSTGPDYGRGTRLHDAWCWPRALHRGRRKQQGLEHSRAVGGKASEQRKNMTRIKAFIVWALFAGIVSDGLILVSCAQTTQRSREAYGLNPAQPRTDRFVVSSGGNNVDSADSTSESLVF